MTVDKARRTSKTALYALVFNLFPEKPPGLVGIKISYFFHLFFLYFSLNRCNTSSNHKNLHLKQRWDVVYRKSNRYAEKRAGQKLNFLIIFLIFFEFFEIGLTSEAL